MGTRVLHLFPAAAAIRKWNIQIDLTKTESISQLINVLCTKKKRLKEKLRLQSQMLQLLKLLQESSHDPPWASEVENSGDFRTTKHL